MDTLFVRRELHSVRVTFRDIELCFVCSIILIAKSDNLRVKICLLINNSNTYSEDQFGLL